MASEILQIRRNVGLAASPKKYLMSLLHRQSQEAGCSSAREVLSIDSRWKKVVNQCLVTMATLGAPHDLDR